MTDSLINIFLFLLTMLGFVIFGFEATSVVLLFLIYVRLE